MFSTFVGSEEVAHVETWLFFEDVILSPCLVNENFQVSVDGLGSDDAHEEGQLRSAGTYLGLQASSSGHSDYDFRSHVTHEHVHHQYHHYHHHHYHHYYHNCPQEHMDIIPVDVSSVFTPTVRADEQSLHASKSAEWSHFAAECAAERRVPNPQLLTDKSHTEMQAGKEKEENETGNIKLISVPIRGQPSQICISINVQGIEEPHLVRLTEEMAERQSVSRRESVPQDRQQYLEETGMDILTGNTTVLNKPLISQEDFVYLEVEGDAKKPQHKQIKDAAMGCNCTSYLATGSAMHGVLPGAHLVTHTHTTVIGSGEGAGAESMSDATEGMHVPTPENANAKSTHEEHTGGATITCNCGSCLAAGSAMHEVLSETHMVADSPTILMPSEEAAEIEYMAEPLQRMLVPLRGLNISISNSMLPGEEPYSNGYAPAAERGLTPQTSFENDNYHKHPCHHEHQHHQYYQHNHHHHHHHQKGDRKCDNQMPIDNDTAVTKSLMAQKETLQAYKAYKKSQCAGCLAERGESGGRLPDPLPV
ncbi:unnamed protein product, partial [Dibothriocephalus latus]